MGDIDRLRFASDDSVPTHGLRVRPRDVLLMRLSACLQEHHRTDRKEGCWKKLAQEQTSINSVEAEMSKKEANRVTSRLLSIISVAFAQLRDIICHY